LSKNDEKVKVSEVSQVEEALSDKEQRRRSFLKHAGKAVYAAPVLFALSNNAFGRPEAPGKTPPGKNAPGRTPRDRTMDSGPPPPPE
jgi:hypothetical protein